MHVTLPKQDIFPTVQLHLRPIIRIEQDPIPHNDRPNIRTNTHGRSPRQATPNRRRSRNHNAGRRLPLPFAPVLAHENSIMKHPDRQAGLGVGVGAHECRRYAARRSGLLPGPARDSLVAAWGSLVVAPGSLVAAPGTPVPVPTTVVIACRTAIPRRRDRDGETATARG